MQTECSSEQLEFSCVERRRVVAAFDGGTVSSDAGALLLGRTDEAIGLIDRLADCFIDHRKPELIEHPVRTLIGQRVFGIALGYEDLNDHEQLRHDPVFAALLGELQARRSDCAALAGKSTLNRLELHAREGVDHYHKIRPRSEAIEALFVELFVEAHRETPEEIVLDLDATDDPLHGHQEGRFFHGYYDGYCYLPLYIFCGEHLLCSKLRRSNIDGAAGAREEVQRIVGQIRTRWPRTRIILRADSGFCREELMSWCEQNAVDYVFGLARNTRLVRAIGAELHEAAQESAHTSRPARRFKELSYRTRRSWSRARRVVGKAEQTGDKANPRFVVTSLSQHDWPMRELYEQLYWARGEMENRIVRRSSGSPVQCDRTLRWARASAQSDNAGHPPHVRPQYDSDDLPQFVGPQIRVIAFRRRNSSRSGPLNLRFRKSPPIRRTRPPEDSPCPTPGGLISRQGRKPPPAAPMRHLPLSGDPGIRAS